MSPEMRKARQESAALPGHRAGIIAIGCSAGCFDSLQALLPLLGKDFPAPVVVVLHIPPDTESKLPSAFQHGCALRVKEAEDKEPIERGTIYFAPSGYHLLVESDKSFSLSLDEPVHFSRPSIDVLFESVAQAYGPKATGIILSGANEDGAQGLKAISDAGGCSVVEDPRTASFSVMPEAAFKASRPQLVKSVPELAAWLPGLDGKGGI